MSGLYLYNCRPNACINYSVHGDIGEISLYFPYMQKKATPSRPPTPRNCLSTHYKLYFYPCPSISDLQIIQPRHSPKSSIFWLKSGIKILSQTPTALDFPSLFQKSNFLPWQMNKTLIINFSYPKMPYNAEFCKVLSTIPGIVFFFPITTLFSKHGKTMQIKAVCSSKNVVGNKIHYYCD